VGVGFSVGLIVGVLVALGIGLGESEGSITVVAGPPPTPGSKVDCLL